MNFWLCFPMFVTDSYDSHIFVVYIYIYIYMTLTSKATDVNVNNVKLLRYMVETLLTKIQLITYAFQQ